MEDDQILYDLIVHEEWTQEPQLLHQVENYFWQYRGSLLKKLWRVTQGSMHYMLDSLKTQFRYQTSFGCPPQHFINLVNHSLSWIVSLSCDGAMVAVLLDDTIEIRISEDFGKVISKCKVMKDKFPQWRKLAWNEDSTMLSYSNSFGDVMIFDVAGTVKHSIPSPNSTGLNVPGTLSLAVVYLEFRKNPKEKSDDSWVLFVCTYQGLLNCYSVSDAECMNSWCFSFLLYHPYGIAGLVYDTRNSLFLAAGNYGKEPFHAEEGCYGSQCAISTWRLLNDTPYLTLVEDQGNAVKMVSGKERLKNIVFWKKTENEKLKAGIYKMQLSWDGTVLATLHINGRISIWSVPSMRLTKTWSKSEQPSHGDTGERFGQHDSPKKEDLSKTSNIVDLTWWSDQEFVLAAGNGCVTISSSGTLLNLLGESPEKFDPWPSVSQVHDGSVLILECEKKVSDPTEKSTKPGNKPKKKWLAETDDGDNEEMDSIRYRFKELMKQTLYFITEAERFLPAIKPPKILTNVYRLVCLKSTTPEELYARKINLEHYGDALDLAKRFNLNTDLVYERQWRSKRVTKISIHDYLTKIKDRYWVLDECVLRIPDDFDATEQLLKYGLLGTSWEILQRIDDENAHNELPFTITKTAEQTADDDGETEGMVFQGSLSPKQLRLCKYRWQLLQYLDRLSTYEVILGGSFKARDKFSKDYFSNFRSCNIVHHAVECARDEDSYSLEHIFSYHGNQVLPFWLPILSNFPETVEMRDYEPVLPEIGELADEPEIFPWLEKHHREEDWVEHPNIMSQIKHNDHDEEDLGDFMFETQPELKRYRDCQSKRVFTEWLIERVHDIDRFSGQIGKCCALLDVGIKRGLKHLDALHRDMQTWETLVYKVGIDSHMTAKNFIALPDESKIRLLMSKSIDETFVKDFKTFLLPFLHRIGKKNFGKRQQLLHDFLVDIARSDLTCCLKLFMKSSPETKEPILADIGEVMKIAIDCIYACKRDDQLEHAFSIVECLPTREEGVISPQIEELHRKLDQLELLLSGAEILQYYSFPQTISSIAENRLDEKVAKNTLRLIIKNVMMSTGKAGKPKELNKLLAHLIKLSKDVYTSCEVKLCHQMFAEGLLQSGYKENIALAVEVLTTSKMGGVLTKKEHHLTDALYALNYDVSVQVVLEAAKEYFNAAASLTDSSMELAKLCLSLITDAPDSIRVENDLINSLYLIGEFNVSILPLQVRLFPDKLEIIDMCLKEKKNSYKKQDRILQISDLLQICGQDVKQRKGQVLTRIADSAFENEDYSYAGITCVQIMENNYSEAWWICRKLGECNKYTNYTIRQNLLSFALTYCPVHHIEEILNEKTILETQVLYEKLSFHIKTDIENDEDNEDDVTDGNNTSILKKTKTTTKKLLSGVTDTKWLGNAMKWATLSGDKRSHLEHNMEARSDDDEGLNRFQYHPFYRSLEQKEKEKRNEKAHGLSDYCEALRGGFNEKKLFNELLLRSQKLSERRSEGTIAEDTDDAISSLMTSSYKEESALCLAYMMALSSERNVQSLIDQQRNNSFTFLFAAYYYALQAYVRSNQFDLSGRANMYHAKPKELLVSVLVSMGKSSSKTLVEGEKTLELFLSNINKLQDLVQAKLLKGLDKGVDVERFAVDDEYKRETILGLAMSLEDELMNTSLLLADKYDVPTWQVMLSHVEFLFTDSGLKAKSIRDSLNKWSVDSHLKEHGDEVFERLKQCVYPDINGKDHNTLLLFYVFLMNCSSPTNVLQGTLTLDAHVKLLKKIKSAAVLDYKQLVHGDSPLTVLQACIDENNVHVFAKVASKIPQKDGSFLTSNKVFLAHVIRMFWRKPEGKNWLNHFETCQSFLNKLQIEDVLEFADSITFTDEAYSLLTQDIRKELTSRVLKYTRQMKGKDEETSKGKDDFDQLIGRYETAIQHLQTLLTHLKRLDETAFQDFKNSTNDTRKDFAKRYDLSRGDKSTLHIVFRDLFTSLQSPSSIEKLSLLTGNDANTKKAFTDAMNVILGGVQETRDLTLFTELTKLVKKYEEDGGSMVIANDILDVVRPFCSDVTVDTEIKSSILHILQASFHLANEDVMLLMFYQSQAVIKPTWGIDITETDVESDSNRLRLFNNFLSMTSNDVQTSALEQLLSSWSPLLSYSSLNILQQILSTTACGKIRLSELPSYFLYVLCLSHDDIESIPWVQLILKKIELNDFILMATLRHTQDQFQLHDKAYKMIFERLQAQSQLLLSCKVMMYSGSEQCVDDLLHELSLRRPDEFNIDVDDEFVNILLENKTFHKMANTHLYEPIITFILKGSNQDFVDQVVAQLHNNGFHNEAGFVYMKSRQYHPAFFTVSNALDLLNWKFKSR